MPKIDKKRPALSFEDDEEEDEDFSAFKIKKSKESKKFKKMRQAPDVIKNNNDTSSSNLETLSSIIGGDYSAESLKKLRQNQNFATACAADAIHTSALEGIELSGEDAEAFTELTERAAIRTHGLSATDIDDTADLEAIRSARIENKRLLKGGYVRDELNYAGMDSEKNRMHLISKPQNKHNMYDLTAENDEAWEEEIMKRGVINVPTDVKSISATERKDAAFESNGTSKLEGDDAKNLITVTDLITTVQLAIDKLQKVCDDRSRRKLQLGNEEEIVLEEDRKLRANVELGVKRLNSIQDIRQYFAALVGMIREKEPMIIGELKSAVITIMKDRANAVHRQKIEEQEDLVYRLKQDGEVLVIGNYVPLTILSSKQIVPESLNSQASNEDKFGAMVEIAAPKHSVVLLEMREKQRSNNRAALLKAVVDAETIAKLEDTLKQNQAPNDKKIEKESEIEGDFEDHLSVGLGYGNNKSGLGFSKSVANTSIDSVDSAAASRSGISFFKAVHPKNFNESNCNADDTKTNQLISKLEKDAFLANQTRLLHGFKKFPIILSSDSSTIDYVSVFELLEFGYALYDEKGAPLASLDQTKATLSQAADAMMEDVDGDAYTVGGITSKLKEFRDSFTDRYYAAYIPLSAVELIHPLVTLDLLPLSLRLFPHSLASAGTLAQKKDFVSLKDRNWFNELRTFSLEAVTRRQNNCQPKGEDSGHDEDALRGEEVLFEKIVVSTVVPWLKEAVMYGFNCYSSKHCSQCAMILNEIIAALNSVSTRKDAGTDAECHLCKAVDPILEELKETISKQISEVFLPVLKLRGTNTNSTLGNDNDKPDGISFLQRQLHRLTNQILNLANFLRTEDANDSSVYRNQIVKMVCTLAWEGLSKIASPTCCKILKTRDTSSVQVLHEAVVKLCEAVVKVIEDCCQYLALNTNSKQFEKLLQSYGVPATTVHLLREKVCQSWQQLSSAVLNDLQELIANSTAILQY